MFNKKSGQSLSSFVLTVDSIHLGPAVVRITVPDMDASKVIGPEPFSCKNLVCGLAGAGIAQRIDQHAAELKFRVELSGFR
jgi:hypothetical protein